MNCFNEQNICNYICTQHLIRGVNFRKQQIQTSINYPMQKDSSETKKDTTEYLKSHSKRSEIYPFSYSTTSNFLCQATTVIDIFEDFEPPSKKFLGKSLCDLTKSYYQKLCKILFQVLVFTLSIKLGLIRILTNFRCKYQNEKNAVLCRTVILCVS